MYLLNKWPPFFQQMADRQLACYAGTKMSMICLTLTEHSCKQVTEATHVQDMYRVQLAN